MKNENTQASTVMRELSAYIAVALKRPLPKDVAEVGKHHLLDTLAAMVSGSRLLPGRKAIAVKHHTLAVRGTAANPMTRVEVEEKCYDFIAPVLGKKRPRSLIDTVWRIEKVADTRALRPLLRA
jgi:hypothetical protein